MPWGRAFIANQAFWRAIHNLNPPVHVWWNHLDKSVCNGRFLFWTFWKWLCFCNLHSLAVHGESPCAFQSCCVFGILFPYLSVNLQSKPFLNLRSVLSHARASLHSDVHRAGFLGASPYAWKGCLFPPKSSKSSNHRCIRSAQSPQPYHWTQVQWWG